MAKYKPPIERFVDLLTTLHGFLAYKRAILNNLTKNQHFNLRLSFLIINICNQMLKKFDIAIAFIGILNSFVANSRQGVQFNKQFVGLTTTN
jgi:hypothetical protein